MPDTVMAPETPANFIVQGPRQRSAQWGELMIALAKAQGEIEGAKKDSVNPAFKQPGKPEGSKYADLASVWDAIRAPMSRHGVAIMQWPRVTESAVEIETIVACGEQFISDVLWMPCGKMDAHGIGSAITYGRRYALMAVAGVAPEDDDGNGAVEGHKPGAVGGASAGADFRPSGPRRFNPNGPQFGYGEGGKQGAIDEARRDGILSNPNDTRSRYEQGKDKKPAGPLGGRAAAADEAKAAKIRAGADVRIKALKEGPWIADTLKRYWDDDVKWREWMQDPENDSLADYERYTTAYIEAQDGLSEAVR